MYICYSIVENLIVAIEDKAQTLRFAQAVEGATVKQVNDISILHDIMSPCRIPPELKLVRVYVDGSHSFSCGKYSSSIVVINEHDKVIEKQSCVGRSQIKLANVAGELIGALMAIQYAQLSRASHLKIYYDYTGIAGFANGQMHAKSDFIKEYVQSVNEARKTMDIEFIHTKSHSGILLNEVVDKDARSALEDMRSFTWVEVGKTS